MKRAGVLKMNTIMTPPYRPLSRDSQRSFYASLGKEGKKNLVNTVEIVLRIQTRSGEHVSN